MTTHHLLIEIGVEELPPKGLSVLAESFSQGIVAGLKTESVLGPDSLVKTFATPRRLAVLVSDVQPVQGTKLVERLGPPVRTAVDSDHQPTKVGLGFAKSCGVEWREIGTKDTPKGPVLYFASEKPGQRTVDLLQPIVVSALNNLPIQKRMRWADKLETFVRPVHWILALIDHDVIPLELFDLKSDRMTYGHRVHAGHGIAIERATAYEETLEASGYVIPCLARRKEKIRRMVQDLVSGPSQVAIDEALLEEVAGLVEWPVAYIGKFNEAFLSVPQECLISSMQEHQKYFPILSQSGALEPRFVVVANLESTDPSFIVSGNEKVITPRLADAEFFYNSDRKVGLTEFRERLKQSVFQEQLGTIYEKTNRIAQLAVFLAHRLDANPRLCEQAGELCKADLASSMVYEFPHLQGTMGTYYAKHAKLADELANAMAEHYMPRFSGDQIPKTRVGLAVALADKADTLMGLFGIDKPPTGSKDPYSLRRQALGIVRILIEAGIDLSLTELFDKAFHLYGGILKDRKAIQAAVAFVLERMPAKYKDDGLPPDTIMAVQALQIDSPFDVHKRVMAVSSFRSLPEAESLASANKRVKNMLKDYRDQLHESFRGEGREPAELALAQALTQCEGLVSPLLAKNDYTGSLLTLAKLKAPVDQFFDQVKVVVDDKETRLYRLGLLHRLNQLFLKVADISQLQ